MPKVTSCFGIETAFIPCYHPEINNVERQNRELKTQLSILAQNYHQDWDIHIPSIRLAINSTTSETTGYTPSYLIYGKKLKAPQDNINDLRAVIESENYFSQITCQLLLYLRQKKDPLTTISEISAKFAPKRDGPYQDTEVVMPTTYHIGTCSYPPTPIGRYQVSDLTVYVLTAARYGGSPQPTSAQVKETRKSRRTRQPRPGGWPRGPQRGPARTWRRRKTATATITKTAPTIEQQATASGTLTRAKRRISRKIDNTEAIRLLQTTHDEATDSSTSDMECSRQQWKRKGSTNFDSDTGRKRSGAKLVPTGGTGPQPVPATAAIPKAKEGRVPPVVLREKARWTTLNTEILRRGIRTTKVVNTNVGIRIQPTTADDYWQLVQAVTALNMQFHSYQLTEDKPLKVVLRGVPEDIAEDEINKDLARQGIRVLECKRMLVGQARRHIPLVFVQLTKSDEAKGIFKITYACGINVTVESKQVKKGQVTQCHRCQLYRHGQGNCHAAAVCVKCAGPHQTAECAKSRDTPARNNSSLQSSKIR
ncbi:hypothetical protein Trydic_g16416 [Trypoxylus dichotomus]